jgi:hypothetical protein
MASRTSLYSFQNNIIEISISIDAIGELHEPNTPLSTEERIEFSLCSGDNPWRNLGVPDSAICKKPSMFFTIMILYTVIYLYVDT